MGGAGEGAGDASRAKEAGKMSANIALNWSFEVFKEQL